MSAIPIVSQRFNVIKCISQRESSCNVPCSLLLTSCILLCLYRALKQMVVLEGAYSSQVAWLSNRGL